MTCAIGMNLANVNYYGTEFPFIDRMKSAGEWIATGATEPIELTAEGYPVRVPKGADSVYTMLGMDPGPGDYVALYEGGSGFFMMGAKVTRQAPGRIEFHYDQPSNQMLLATSDVSVRNVRVVRAEHEAMLAAGYVFNPAFSGKIAAFDTLRYMDWNSTNNTNVSRWQDRTLPTARTWLGKGDNNVPIETMVALANCTMTNMWLNVPTRADDDYVRQMLTYVHTNLDPKLSCHVEYCNEVWNWGFQQAGYSHAEAAKLWGTDANGDGHVDPADRAEQYGQGWVTWYGYRSAQIARIAREVFAGALDRLRMVIATQTVWLGLEDWIFDGVARAGGTVEELFDEYAITSYFDGYLRAATAEDRAMIGKWAMSGEVGMAAAFAALHEGTGLSSSEGSLAWLRDTIYPHQAAVAAKHGLDLVAYEGGVDLSSGAATGGPDIAALYVRLQADPRMGGTYTRMVEDFGAAGGKLLLPLIDVDAGYYGTLKSIYDEGSPEWDALVAALRAARGTGTPPPPIAEPLIPVLVPVPAVLVPAPAPDPLPIPVVVTASTSDIYAALAMIDSATDRARVLIRDYRR